MVHYKFFYFPVRGRGEPIRHLLLLSGKKYEEVTVTMEEWPNYKSQMPLGQMPVLEVDGVKLAQTATILRFLGHQFHMAGKGAIECARLDMISEVVQDMLVGPGLSTWGPVLLGFVQTDKEEFFKEKILPDVHKHAPTIERFLINNGGNGLFIGDHVTWVDVFAAEMFSRIQDFGSADALDAYPNIIKLIHRIHSLPVIKRRIDSRPPLPC